MVEAGGTVYATGEASLLGSTQAALTVKLDRSGKKLWSKLYAGAQGADGLAAAARPGGGVYVAGWCATPAFDLDAMVLRYTASGSQKLFTVQDHGGDGEQQVFFDVAVASTGNVIAAGHTLGTGPDAMFTNYAPDGSIVWAPVLAAGPWGDAFQSVVTDRFGGYYLLGHIATAADKDEIYLYRGSVNSQGGFWQSVNNGGGTASDGGVAVWNMTVYAVGSVNTVPAEGWNQLVLGYVY